MNTKSITWLVLIWIIILNVISAVEGHEFQRPPETYAPFWETPYPYQRNIDWDFSKDPRSNLPHYEGYYDDYLRGSDYVTFTGDVTWYASILGYDGVIGIDNTSGTTTLTGTVLFHIDNLVVLKPVKHIWDEADYWIEGKAKIWEDMGLPPGYEVVADVYHGPWVISEDPKLVRDNWYWKIEPNPPLEDKVIGFEVPAGDFAFVDRYHIATECIPEPATVVFLGLGGLVLLRRRRNA